MPPKSEIERYLRTGDHDPLFSDWPGQNLFARAQAGQRDLRSALIAEVLRRTPDAVAPAEIASLDVAAFTRKKVEPMIRGLFPHREQAPVLDVLSHSVVFLAPDSIVGVLKEERWLNTVWDLANLYLGSFGAELLGPQAPRILGLAVETKCYVSVEYFGDGNDLLADFIVHETAHVFHNCKRRTMGLPHTRRREWPLELAFGKRETFAYACEAYSRILELARTTAERKRLLEEHASRSLPGHDSVDHAEYLDILREAVAARNGWKKILARCAPPPPAPLPWRSDQAVVRPASPRTISRRQNQSRSG